MRPRRHPALSAALLLASTACSTPAVMPSLPPIETPPARCSVLCPEIPRIDPDPMETIKALQDWGSDCRLRQIECAVWIKRKDNRNDAPAATR